MKNMLLFASLSLFATACTDDNETTQPPEPETPSIMETARSSSNLSTLVAVVEFASDNGDLVNLLSEPGTFTVFAPTNAAFDSLATELTGTAGTPATALLTAENRPLLRKVLQYHVLGSEVRAAGIPFGKAITSAEGSIFKIESGASPQIIDGRNRAANIVATDVTASNGVVHLIDKVILPANKNVVEIAQGNPNFSILVDAVIAAELAGTLSGQGPFTVFAPTNDAFAALLDELRVTKEQLLANKELLTAVLTYHVVPARVLKADAPIGAPVSTVHTGTFMIGGDLRITDGRGRSAQIMSTDLFATNGVIHVIDKVILPAAQ